MTEHASGPVPEAMEGPFPDKELETPESVYLHRQVRGESSWGEVTELWGTTATRTPISVGEGTVGGGCSVQVSSGGKSLPRWGWVCAVGFLGH